MFLGLVAKRTSAELLNYYVMSELNDIQNEYKNSFIMNQPANFGFAVRGGEDITREQLQVASKFVSPPKTFQLENRMVPFWDPFSSSFNIGIPILATDELHTLMGSMGQDDDSQLIYITVGFIKVERATEIREYAIGSGLEIIIDTAHYEPFGVKGAIHGIPTPIMYRKNHLYEHLVQ